MQFSSIAIPPPTLSLYNTFSTLKSLQKDHLEPHPHIGDHPSQQVRGLRFISGQLKKLLAKNKKLTYHEISRILVENFGGEDRQQKNIKRRVYDAINVLMAIGVLTKTQNFISMQIPKLQSKDDTLTKKRQLLKAKKNTLSNLKKLINRNKIIEERENKPESHIIPKIKPLPYIFNCPNSTLSNCNIQPTLIAIKSNHPIKYLSPDCYPTLL